MIENHIRIKNKAYLLRKAEFRMEQQERVQITVETTVSVKPTQAWEYWTEPKHITKWNQASEDWHTPHAENDLRVGGKFSSRIWSRKRRLS